MPVLIALLRGINVGGHNLVKMDKLRSICESCGFEFPRTYLQSGNVVFTPRSSNPGAIAAKLEAAIERELGFRPAVILRTQAELERIISANPFAARPNLDRAKLVVIFLKKDPGQQAREKVVAIQAGPEEIGACGRELYVYYAGGIGKSRLTPALLEKALGGISGTARNWNTVNALLALAEQPTTPSRS